VIWRIVPYVLHLENIFEVCDMKRGYLQRVVSRGGRHCQLRCNGKRCERAAPGWLAVELKWGTPCDAGPDRDGVLLQLHVAEVDAELHDHEGRHDETERQGPGQASHVSQFVESPDTRRVCGLQKHALQNS